MGRGATLRTLHSRSIAIQATIVLTVNISTDKFCRYAKPATHFVVERRDRVRLDGAESFSAPLADLRFAEGG